MLLQKKVDKMRSDFVHTMIHELKRPVQTLKMCVSVFSAQKTDEKDENALIMETVREESDNLTAYLAKLREVIRAEEHIPLQITSFDIHAALLNLVAVYRKNRQKEVNVSLDYQRTSDLMMGDRDQLLNVVSNLMENSVKYSGDIVNIHVAEEFPAAAWLRCDLCRQWQEGMGTVPGGEARPGIARHQYAGDGWL